ncbi:MAG: hypothetical protein ACO1N0_22095 [Fluviicola sp.]
MGTAEGESRGLGVAVYGFNIYVAGYQYNGNKYISKLWHNGNATVQNDNILADAYGNGIFVSGSDVYVAGEEDNGNLSVAKYWKNSTSGFGVPNGRTTVTLSAANSGANSIFIKGNDVYVVGYEFAAGRYQPTIWKNGIATSLSNSLFSGNANSVFVK